MLFASWTYPNKGPVTEVVDSAEEPKLVEEKIGSCHSALVWRGQRKHKNILRSLSVIKNIQVQLNIQSIKKSRIQ